MSGHSKWNNIKRKKGASDAAKAKVFTKVAREMSVAVKEGGPDPETNGKLRDCIAKAKAANMPNDNIKRTIDKALGSGNTDNYDLARLWDAPEELRTLKLRLLAALFTLAQRRSTDRIRKEICDDLFVLAEDWDSSLLSPIVRRAEELCKE